MASVIPMLCCGILLGFELTKLLNICDFSSAKDSGKVLITIIIIYYYYYIAASLAKYQAIFLAILQDECQIYARYN